MHRARTTGVLLLASLGVASCSLFKGAMSQPPTIVPRTWQSETVLIEAGNAEFGVPTVFVDAQGRPAVAAADRSFYMGTQAVALGRRFDDGWRVDFPVVPAPERLCGQAGEGEAVVLTHGGLDGPLSAVSWDGVVDAPAPASPCEPGNAPKQPLGAADSGQFIEQSADARTLWHRVASGEGCGPHDAEPGHKFGSFAVAVDGQGLPQMVVFERTAEDGPGRLRHVSCKDAAWTSSVVADGVVVISTSLALDSAGQPHIGYVVDGEQGLQLTYAAPVEAGLSPLPEAVRDPRVVPAVEACLRVHALPPKTIGVERYQKGDGFRCGVLERDPEPPKQALALATERCEAGEAGACAVAGSLHHWLMGDVSIMLQLPQGGSNMFTTEWTGLRPAGVTEDPARAAELYGKACEGGDARGCLHGAVLLPAEDPRRLIWARTACKGEMAHGCSLAVAQTGMKPKKPLIKMAIPGLRRACEADDIQSCASLGVVLVGQKDLEGARVPLQRACDAQIVSACAGLAAINR